MSNDTRRGVIKLLVAVIRADVRQAVYLSVLGWDVKPVTLSPWLYLIPVLFLEFGSALGVVLVRAVLVNETASGVEENHEVRTMGTPHTAGVPSSAAKDAKPQEMQAFQGVPAISAKTDDEDDDSGPGGRLGTRLLGHLEHQGGTVKIGQRGLAKLLGTSTTELHRTLHQLSTVGAVTVDTSRRGTVVALAPTI